jgi:hypothetical protein
MLACAGMCWYVHPQNAEIRACESMYQYILVHTSYISFHTVSYCFILFHTVSYPYFLIPLHTKYEDLQNLHTWYEMVCTISYQNTDFRKVA